MKKLRLQKETLVHLQGQRHRIKPMASPDLRGKQGGSLTPFTPPLVIFTQSPTGCTCTPRWVSVSTNTVQSVSETLSETTNSWSQSRQDPSVKPSAPVQDSLPMGW